jgi:hypothetical protein
VPISFIFQVPQVRSAHDVWRAVIAEAAYYLCLDIFMMSSSRQYPTMNIANRSDSKLGSRPDQK